jgi:hypothetical protein
LLALLLVVVVAAVVLGPAMGVTLLATRHKRPNHASWCNVVVGAGPYKHSNVMA